MPAPPITAAVLRNALITELRSVWRTPQFWGTGFTDLLFVLATALILTYFEALPHNASLLLGDVLKSKQ